RCTTGAPTYGAPSPTQGAAAGDPFWQSTDRTISAGQNDSKDEQSPAPSWMIISGGHHVVRAVADPLLLLHLHR
ncbi:hypothetical protein ACLOJK_019039, partial [Asimina triloba]